MKSSRTATLLENMNIFDGFSPLFFVRMVVLVIAMGLFAVLMIRTRRAFKRYRRSRRKHRIVPVLGYALGLILCAVAGVMAVII